MPSTLPPFATATRVLISLILGISLACLLGFIALIAYPLDTTYKVSAHTERANIQLRTAPQSRWPLHDVDLYIDGSTVPIRFTGMIALGDSLSVDLRRVAYGPLFVRITANARSNSVGWFYTLFDDPHPLGRAGKVVEINIEDLRARADSGKTVTLPILGDVTVGRVFGHTTIGAEGLLQSGVVTMTGRSLIRGDVFEAGRTELDVGDRFFLTGSETPAFGFITADHRPGFTIAYRAVAKAGRIVRPGSDSGYSISASLLEQVTNDRVFQGISILFGVLTVLSTLLVGASRVANALRRWGTPSDNREGPSTHLPSTDSRSVKQEPHSSDRDADGPLDGDSVPEVDPPSDDKSDVHADADTLPNKPFQSSPDEPSNHPPNLCPPSDPA